MTRNLINIAADLATLPNDDTPEFIYQRCKQLAVELKEYHDAHHRFSYANARQRYLNDAVFNNFVNALQQAVNAGALTLADAKDAVSMLESQAANPQKASP